MKKSDLIGRYIKVNSSSGNWMIRVLKEIKGDTLSLWNYEVYVYTSDHKNEIHRNVDFWIRKEQDDWEFIDKDYVRMELFIGGKECLRKN